MKKYLSILLLVVFIIPAIASASWWNPFSWKIFRKKNINPIVVSQQINLNKPQEELKKEQKEAEKQIKNTSKEIEKLKKDLVVSEKKILTDTKKTISAEEQKALDDKYRKEQEEKQRQIDELTKQLTILNNTVQKITENTNIQQNENPVVPLENKQVVSNNIISTPEVAKIKTIPVVSFLPNSNNTQLVGSLVFGNISDEPYFLNKVSVHVETKDGLVDGDVYNLGVDDKGCPSSTCTFNTNRTFNKSGPLTIPVYADVKPNKSGSYKIIFDNISLMGISSMETVVLNTSTGDIQVLGN